ncbi:MAG: isopentenyl phosphate kinase family protein [Chloroflexi bacterium]|nr:isopentenyl phosphate kinase family protein [Chloroflexota bacterium]
MLDELVLLKLGGSLITDKQTLKSARNAVIQRLAEEIAFARKQSPSLRMLIGHGSGSFGHPIASSYQVRAGNLADWHGYAATSAVVQELDVLVVAALLDAGIPAVAVQPSASSVCQGGELQSMQSEVIRALLDHGAVPVVYGDVAVDRQQGCTIISTEQIFCYLAPILLPSRIILAGRTLGVFSADPQIDAQAHLIPELDAATLERLGSSLSGAGSIDVTGGMASKVRLMWSLLNAMPEIGVRIISGEQPGVLAQTIMDPSYQAGTLLRRRPFSR